jgi:hypothetical protein
MHHAVAHNQKSTIGRASIVTATLALLGDAAPSVAARLAEQLFITPTQPDDRQEGDTMKRATSPKRSAMPMLHRLIRRWVDLGFDLAGLAISEHDIINDLGAGRD